MCTHVQYILCTNRTVHICYQDRYSLVCVYIYIITILLPMVCKNDTCISVLYAYTYINYNTYLSEFVPWYLEGTYLVEGNFWYM